MSADLLKLLIETTIASTFAIVAVLLLRVPLRHFFGARVAYALWCLVPFALVAVMVPAQEIVIKVVSQPVTAVTTAAPVTTAATATTAIAMPASNNSPDLFLLLWMVGIAACAFWFSRQQKKFIGSLGALNLCYEKVFLADNNSQGPAVIGVVQPRIVLPSDFERRYSREEQNLVLTHEQIHLERGDTRINLVAAALRCIFWFNPLLHWADGRFRFDQELSTDANVLSKFPASRKSYADAMLKTQMASIGLPVACHWQAHHPLKERILMLKKSTPGKIFRWSGLCLVALLCLGSAFAAWSMQPANIIVSPVAPELLYEIQIDTKIDHVDLARIKLREAPGKPFAVSNGKGDRDWSYEFSISPLDKDFVQLKGKVMFGATPISEPVMKLPIGRMSSVDVGFKNNGSYIILNMVVSEVRNGKLGPVLESRANLDGYHFFQNHGDIAKLYSDTDLSKMQLVAVDSDQIAKPAKLLPSAKFLKHVAAGKNAGKKIVRVSVLVDEKGYMMGGNFIDSFADTSSGMLNQALDLLMMEKYQPAIGKNGKPVASNITVELYDNFEPRAIVAGK